MFHVCVSHFMCVFHVPRVCFMFHVCVSCFMCVFHISCVCFTCHVYGSRFIFHVRFTFYVSFSVCGPGTQLTGGGTSIQCTQCPQGFYKTTSDRNPCRECNVDRPGSNTAGLGSDMLDDCCTFLLHLLPAQFEFFIQSPQSQKGRDSKTWRTCLTW